MTQKANVKRKVRACLREILKTSAEVWQIAMGTMRLDGDNVPNRKKRKIDWPFLILVLIILSVGLAMVFSASFASSYYENKGDSTYYIAKQLKFAAGGLVIMLVASRIPTRVYRALSMPVLAASAVLLMLVLLIGTGTEEDGAEVKRWINLGITTFQPSELAKFGTIMAFAALIDAFGDDRMKTFKYGIAPFVAILAVELVLLYEEPHLSAMIIILSVGAALMFIGGIRLYWVGLGGVGAIGGAYMLFNVVGYASSRIDVWRDPFNEAYRTDGAWQTIQSLYSIGSGGLLGLGLGKSRQKYLFLPEEHNDFIFAVVCEELGFIGALLVLLLFALMICRGYWIAAHARDRYSSLLVSGITTLFALQTFLNVAVVTNLIPCTGVSLPFFSYGGTALVVQLAEVGVVLSVSKEIPLREEG